MDIRTEGVQAVLGGSAILKGVDIQVGQRELVGIIGPNGSGKSTLLKCIYRVLKPTGGAVLLDGRDLDQYSYRESARRIAVVAQHNYYNFEFSVQDVVMMGRAPHKRALDRDNADDFRLVAEALELVGMSGFARRSFSPLSGGEQQRAALAKVLLLNPEILLLDEPTKGLDAEFKQVFAEILQILLRRGTAVLMVSHDIEFCARYAHRCALFFDGSIVTEAPPRAFFSGNSFYTTAANRMARQLLPRAVTVEDVIAACGGQVPPAPALPEDIPLLPEPEEASADYKPKPLPWWRKLGAAPGAGGGRRVLQTKTADLVAQAGRGADRSYGLPPVPVLHEHHRFDQIDHRRRYDRAGKPSNVSVCALYSLVVPVCCLHYAPVTPEGLCPPGAQSQAEAG